MNLREIEAFRAVMLCGTASRAAEMLNISQPAVTKAIQALERSIHFALFERTKGRLVPTPEGQIFFREVEQSFVGLARLQTAAARIRDFGSGEIRIACLSAFSTSIAPLAIAQFQARHPKVAITFQVASSSSIRDLVAAGQFDIGLAADEIDTTGVEARHFAETTAMIALPPKHPLCDQAVIRPKHLDGHAFVALAPEDTTRREADALFESAGSKPRVVIETPYSTTICAFVVQGLGCGLVDPVTASGYIERGLVLRPFAPKVRFRVLMLFPPGRQKSVLLRDCVKAFQDARRALVT
jgi:DNA-binding transcriptional LysR family regulator